MERLVKTFLHILLITSLISINMDCDRWQGETDWHIEWTFISTTGSLDQISYLIEIWTEDDTIAPDCDLDGFLEIKNDSTGLLCRTYVSEGKTLFLKRDPTVKVKLFNIDTVVFFDSLFTWEEMDFKYQYSHVDNSSYRDLSKKTIYIDIPHLGLELLSEKY